MDADFKSTVPSNALVKAGASSPGVIQPAHPFTRSSVWYPDGNCILVAGDAAIRVYRGLLADHSLVLRILFAEPHLLKTYLGTPTVRFADIDVRHLEHVCRWVLGERDLLSRLTIGEVAACYHVAQRLSMQRLLDASMAVMRAFYPHGLSAWRTRMQARRDVTTTDHLLAASVSVTYEHHAIAAMALFETLRAGGLGVAMAVIGSLARGEAHIVHPALADHLRAMALVAYPALVGWQGRLHDRMLGQGPLAECVTLRPGHECHEEMHGAVRSLVHNASMLYTFDYPCFEACAPCERAFRRTVRKRQRKLHGVFPTFFGLPLPAPEEALEPNVGLLDHDITDIDELVKRINYNERILKLFTF